jgi:hypothetical protein
MRTHTGMFEFEKVSPMNFSNFTNRLRWETIRLQLGWMWSPLLAFRRTVPSQTHSHWRKKGKQILI